MPAPLRLADDLRVRAPVPTDTLTGLIVAPEPVDIGETVTEESEHEP